MAPSLAGSGPMRSRETVCAAQINPTKTHPPSHPPLDTIHALDALWRIAHHDGDEEDLEEAELFIALYARELQSNVEPELDDAEEWALEKRESAEEGGEAEGEEEEEGEEGDREGDGEGDEEGGGDDSAIRDALDKFVPFILKCRQESASSAQLKQLTRDGVLMMRDVKQAFGASRPGELRQLSTWPCATHPRVYLSPCLLARSQTALAQAAPRRAQLETPRRYLLRAKRRAWRARARAGPRRL